MKEDKHSGVIPDALETIQIDDIDEIYELDILSLSDSRDLNLLMLAAERGDENSLKYLLKFGFDVDALGCDKSAIDLAWEHRHYNIVLELLNANSLFPKKFNKNDATEDIVSFIDRAQELHKLIRMNQIEQLCQILDDNLNIRHFYNTNNKSAAARALLSKNIEIYKFLISRNVYIGPKEDFNKILRKLNEENRENLQEIHLNYIQPWAEKHLMILTSNSFVGHDINDVDEKLKYVKEAFEFLDKSHPLISLILKTVAASRDFKIIFDFNRFSINHLDPVSSHFTKGIFYTTRHIYIAAKQILNSQTKLQTYGTIAHELCHFALLLVYNNNCNPYFDSDVTSKLRYSAIAFLCNMRSHHEELIDYVFNCYKAEQQHAELAVRVPQMTVEYSSDKEKLENRRQNYQELFEFMENEVHDDMEEALSDIENQADEKIQKFAHKIHKHKRKIRWLWILSGFLVLSIPLSVWTAIALIVQVEEIYGCKNLTVEAKIQVFESVVDFQGARVVFSDVFGDGPTACEPLRTEDVMRILKGPQNVTCCDYKQDWNLTGYNKTCKAKTNQILPKRHNFAKLRKQSLKIQHRIDPKLKFYVHRSMTIYGEKLGKEASFYKDIRVANNKNIIITSSFSIYKKIRLEYNRGSFFRINLNTSESLLKQLPNVNDNKTVLVDFLTTDIYGDNFEYAKTRILENNSIIIWSKIDTLEIDNFNTALRLIRMVSELTTNFQWIISSKYEDMIVDKLNLFDNRRHCSFDEAKIEEFSRKIKKSYVLSIDSYWQNEELDIQSFMISIQLLFHEINRNRVHLLADTAGSGKSTTFRHMSWELKQNFPHFWVSYISLKDHVGAIQNISQFLTNVTTLSDFIASKILNLTTQIELKIFNEKFAKNQTIFLWDGVDEISPKVLNETLQMTSKIFESTKNHQWISTRPQHQNITASLFKVPIMKLTPYDRDNRREFIERFLESKNMSTAYALDIIESFVKRLEAEELVKDHMIHSPLMLFLICDAYNNSNMSLDNSTNLYTFYESYIDKQLAFVQEKGIVVTGELNWIHRNGAFCKAHQQFALLTIFDNNKRSFLNQLDIMKENFSDILIKILRYGLTSLVFNQNDQIEFVHKTFAEFFVAQYFYTNIYTARNAVDSDEMKLRINLLIEVFTNEEFKIVCDFIDGFLDESYVGKFHRIISTSTIHDLLNAKQKLSIVKVITKFFKRDQSLVSGLWNANGNKTFFHEYLKENPGYVSYSEISKIVDANFSPESQRKIFLGKFQTVSIIFKVWIGDYDCLVEKFLDLDCEKIKEISTGSELSDFIKSRNFSMIYFENFHAEFEFEMLNYDDLNGVYPKTFWKLAEENLHQNFIKLRLKDFFIQIQNIQNNDVLMRNVITRIEHFFTNDEILDLVNYKFKNNRTFISLATKFNPQIYKTLWTFVENHLNKNQLKMFLEGENPTNFINDLHYFEDFDTFEVNKKAIFNLFSKTELQSIILSSENICGTFYEKSSLIFYPSSTSCDVISKFIREIFEQSMSGLKEFFTKNCTTQKVNLIQLLNDKVYFCRYNLVHLATEVFTKSELQEFLKADDLQAVFEHR